MGKYLKIFVFILSLIFFLLISSAVVASQLPVFRYALENWQPETYELIIIYRNELTNEETAIVEWMEKNSHENLPYSNYRVRSFDLESDDVADMPELESHLISASPARGYRFVNWSGQTPFFVLLSPAERGRNTIICKGPLTFETVKILVDSPARKEIAERILAGDSAVWILIESGTFNDAVADEILNAALTRMNEIFSPEKSETGDSRNSVSHMPISFSMLRLSRNNPLETYFINILLGDVSQTRDSSYPTVIPIFGRGRVFDLFRGDILDKEKIRAVSEYLVGACEEESKQLNPGYDLLMLADWDSGIRNTWFFVQSPEKLLEKQNETILPGMFSYSFTIKDFWILLIALVLVVSLTVNARFILNMPKKACLKCHAEGTFLSLNSMGICRSCAPEVNRIIDSINKTIHNNIALLRKSSTATETRKLCDIIIDRAKELIKYEKMGITTPLNPRELIEQCTEKLDAITMAKKPDEFRKALTVAHSALTPFAEINSFENALNQIVRAEESLRRMNSTTKIIAFINQKGGVGKTTSTVNVGAGLVKMNKKVLLVDFDPQANLTDCLGVEEESYEYSIYDFLKRKVDLWQVIIHKHNLSIVPSHGALSKIEQEYGDYPRRNTVLRDVLKDIDNYDYILIDCPPTLGLLTMNALSAANDIYIPFIPEYFALKGIEKTLNIIDYIKRTYNNDLEMQGMIGTRYDARKGLHLEVIEKIEQSIKNSLFYLIREDVAFSEASSYGQPVFEYKPHSIGAEDYMGMCKKILQKSNISVSSYTKV